MIRVLIVDDHEVVRQGLKSLLRDTEISVVGEASSGQQGIEEAERIRPDVLLLDVRMPDADGIVALEGIRKQLPDLPVVIFTSYDNPTYVARSVALGAADFVLKGAPRDELVAAIAHAAEGKGPLEDSLLHRVKGTMARHRERPDDAAPLTTRELQVLRHVALGLSNREIGRSLDISVETVKEHVQNILRKIEVNDRTQAAVWAVRRGLV